MHSNRGNKQNIQNLNNSQQATLNTSTLGLGINTATNASTLGSNTTATAAATSNTSTQSQTATSNTTASSSTSSSSAATTTITFKILEDYINKWMSELDSQEKDFLNQATQLNALDKLMIENGDKVN